MKSIKEIESMDMESLEAIAGDRSIEIPTALEDMLMSTAAGAILEEERHGSTHRGRYAAYAISLTAAACMVLFLNMPSQPKDTFDDPLVAYAELEKTFSYISSKMDKGLEIASGAEPVFEKTANALNTAGKKN